MAGPEHSEAPQAVLDPQLELQGVCEEQSQASHQTAGVTSDAAAQQQLIAQIVEQVNFYFGDTNLPTDAFLLKEIRKSPDGWGEPLLESQSIVPQQSRKGCWVHI